MKRIWADFNSINKDGSIWLNCLGSLRDIDDLKEPLIEGETVVLTDDEIEVDAIVHKHESLSLWKAEPISEYRDLI